VRICNENTLYCSRSEWAFKKKLVVEEEYTNIEVAGSKEMRHTMRVP